MINKKKQHQIQQQIKQKQMRAPQKTSQILHQMKMNVKIITWKTKMEIVFTKTVFLMMNQARKRILNQVRQMILEIKIVVIQMNQIKKVRKIQIMIEIVVRRVEEVRMEVEEEGEILNRKGGNLKEEEKTQMDRVKVYSKSFK